MSEEIKQIVDSIVGELRSYLQRQHRAGFYVTISPGPGTDEQGAPGLGSAVALKLCEKAVDGPWQVQGVTYTVDGYTRDNWVKAAGNYVQKQGLAWQERDVTEIANAFAKTGPRELRDSQGTYATKVRGALASEEANGLRFASASGCSAIARYIFRVTPADDFTHVMPVGNLNRTTLIRIGEYLGVPRRILDQRPSNGAVEEIEASRIVNRIFPTEDGRPDRGVWEPGQSRALDQMLHNLQTGRDVNTGVDAKYHSGGKNTVRYFSELEGQLEVCMPLGPNNTAREKILF